MTSIKIGKGRLEYCTILCKVTGWFVDTQGANVDYASMYKESDDVIVLSIANVQMSLIVSEGSNRHKRTINSSRSSNLLPFVWRDIGLE